MKYFFISVLLFFLYQCMQFFVVVSFAHILGISVLDIYQLSYEYAGDGIALSVGIASVCIVLLLHSMRSKMSIDWKAYCHFEKIQQARHLLYIGILYVVLSVVFQHLIEYFDVRDDFAKNIYASTTYPYIMVLGICLCGPFMEELFFRGLLYKGLLNVTQKPWLCAILLSIVFSLLHLQYASPLIYIMIFSFSMLFYAMRIQTRSIYPSLLFHIANNILTFYLIT